jgi:hypothetical protein
MADTGSGKARRRGQGSRRARQQPGRSFRVHFSLTEQEFAALDDAAGRAGLARGAFAAQVVLAHVNGSGTGPEAPDREALRELVRAAGLVRKIGVNLNQAVTKLNATGQRSGDLIWYARKSMRHVEHLDETAEQVRKALR